MAGIPNPISFEGFVIGVTTLTSQHPRPGPAPQRSMASALSTIQKRMSITDLSRFGNTTDPDANQPAFLEAHFNPKEFRETIEVVWSEIPIPGMSHKRLQYHLTENIPFKFDLHFDSLQQVDASLRGTAAVMQARRFLQSLCYAREGAQSVPDGAPPRVLLYWPNFLSLTCVVKTQEWVYQQFFTDGTPRMFTCSMTLKEIRDVRLTSSAVLKGDSKRNAPYPPVAPGEQIISV